MDDLVGEYICEDNENKIRVYSVDGKMDELHFGDEIGEDWLVIGYRDLVGIIDRARRTMKVG